MRKYILACFIVLAGMSLAAQEEETLFGRGAAVGGFGSPLVEFCKVGDDFGVTVGGGGGVIINGFWLGGFGQGGSIGKTRMGITQYHRALGYGGLWLGYVYPSEKAVHLYTSLKLGWGGVSLYDPHGNFEENIDGQAFFTLIPEVGIELNFFRWFRLAGTVGYRWANGIDGFAGLTDQDLSGINGGLIFRFGGFGHKKGRKGEGE